MNPLDFDFMRRALVAAAAVGLAAPAVGVFLVQRRLSLMGDGIGHVALPGVAAGFLTGTSPVLGALVAAVLGAVVIEALRRRGRTAGDLALAVIFYGGIALGVLLTSVAGASGTNLFAYLFGSVLTVSTSDLRLIVAVAALVAALVCALRKELFAASYDEEVARASGLPVDALNLTIAVVTAVTIAVAMKIVGILLVSGMLVLPVAAAQQLARSYRATVAGSIALGLTLSVGGLLAAFYADVQPGPAIVMGAIVVFGVAATVSHLRRPA